MFKNLSVLLFRKTIQIYVMLELICLEDWISNILSLNGYLQVIFNLFVF